MKFVRCFLVCFLCLCACYTTVFNISYNTDKQYRFLLMISSFKRPIFASGQVFRLMSQTYQNFDLSLSLKGVDKKYSVLTFEKEFLPYINKGRLFLRYDKNGGQLSNLLDTVRNIDLQKYDYFCKIDDDDWYAPEYLQSINDELNDAAKRGMTVDTTSTTNAYLLGENISTTVMSYNKSDLAGPTMCFSRRLIELAFMIEKNPDLYNELLPNEPRGLIHFYEDRMLFHLAEYWDSLLQRRTSEPLVVYGQQYRSVMRNNNYVDKEKAATVDKLNLSK